MEYLQHSCFFAGLMYLSCSLEFCLPQPLCNFLLSFLFLSYAIFCSKFRTPSLPHSNYLLPLAGLYAPCKFARYTMALKATLTPAQLSTYPIHAPPDGVQSNFSTTAENNNKPMIIITSFVLAFTLIFYSNRMYTKAFIVRRFSWDDCKFYAPKAAEGTYLTITVTITLAFVRCRSPHTSPAHLSCPDHSVLDWFNCVVCHLYLGYSMNSRCKIHLTGC